MNPPALIPDEGANGKTFIWGLIDPMSPGAIRSRFSEKIKAY
jgi:hypothetical protein